MLGANGICFCDTEHLWSCLELTIEGADQPILNAVCDENVMTSSSREVESSVLVRRHLLNSGGSLILPQLLEVVFLLN